MAPLTPRERFVTLIGGEQNLPPKIPEPPPQPEPAEDESKLANDDQFSKLTSVDSLIAEQMLSKDEAVPSYLKGNIQPAIQPQFTPVATHAPPQLSDADLSLDPRMGEAAPLGINFSPFAAITKFCYKFVSREYQQPLATAFFDANKIYNRDWDLYYIWSDYYPTAKAVTFVPEHQLQALLCEINRAFPSANISITDELCDEGLVIDFGGLRNELRPKWLGHLTSRAQHDHWITSVPVPLPVTAPMAEDRSWDAFKAKMELAVEAAAKKTKAKKKMNQQATIQRRQENVRQVLRAQRYLGLLPKKDEDLMPDMTGLSLSAIYPTEPPPHPFDLDVIFIAIDVEAYERLPKVVTEVGVATLDTRDLRGKAPGPVGGDWQKHIRGRHFRIIEHKRLINRDFCVGCPDDFEFGKSEFVGMDKIASALTGCFHQPFSKPQDNGSAGVGSEAGTTEEKRTIVLVGHNVGQDIDYLHKIGFGVLNRGNLLETMDTSVMYRSYAHEPNPSALSKILYHFNLEAWRPHNAGNDAVYTIMAFLAIAVKAASERGSEEAAEKHEEKVAKKTEVAIEQAKERVLDEDEGWGARDGDDGGVALPPTGGTPDNGKGKANRPTFGPPRPPSPSASGGLFTMGGAPLDV